PRLHIIAKDGRVEKWALGNINSLKLSPGEKIQIETPKDKRISELEIEYTLLDLKTKTKKYKKFNSADFEEITLKPDNDFELRINYVLQKESIGTVYIHARPYWYQSAIIYFIGLVIILMIAYLITTLRLRKKIQSSEEEQQKLEQAAIRLQMLLNPHFTFNALSSIQGLINTDRILEANQYLEEFGSLLRQTLSRSNQVYTSLDIELEMMRMYISIEAFRFNFSWTIEVVGELNPSVIEIPTLLLQPLIENSIKHGLMSLGEKGKLCIICREGSKAGTLIIEIKDNGTWQGTRTGHGLTLTEQRILIINKMRKEKAIELSFNKIEGTEVSLTFLNWINQ
ncbi:MAG: sensor histidine kinase, partial [Bacteroidia bacterium]